MSTWRLCILLGGLLFPFAAGLLAQTTVRDRVVLHPLLLPAKSDSAGNTESEYNPCNPPPSDPGPPLIRRVALYYGDSLSLGAATCPGCPPHHMQGEITSGQEYVRLSFRGTPGACGEITGTTFHFREAWGCDVIAVFDAAQPADFVIVTFTMTYLDFPPPNQETIEVHVVRPEYAAFAHCSPCQAEHGSSLMLLFGAGHWCAGAYPYPVTYSATIVEGEDLGLLVDPVSGARGSTLTGLTSGIEQGGRITFEASGTDPDSARRAIVRVTPSAAELQPVDVTLAILPGPTCPVITLLPDRLSAGDTAVVLIQRQKMDNSVSPYPADTRFWVGMYEGYEITTLSSPWAPDTGDVLEGVPVEGLTLIVTGEPEADSVRLLLWTSIYSTGEMTGGAGSGEENRDGGGAPALFRPERERGGKPPIPPRPAEGAEDCNFGKGMVEDNPRLQILSPCSAMVRTTILPVPEMPDLAPIAQVQSWRGGPVTFSWVSAIEWENTRETPARVFQETLEGETEATNSAATTWQMNWGEVMRGGVLNLRVSVDIGIPVQAVELLAAYKVVGMNPPTQQVKEGIDLECQVVIYMESRPKWCHFDSEGFPIFGVPHGYGLMQIDNPRATDQQVWNWFANRSAGVALFSEKKSLAVAFPRRVREPATRGELPPAFANATDFHSEELLLKESFQRYNGGGFWEWAPLNRNNPSSPGRWQPRRGSSGYGLRAWSVYTSVQQGTPPQDWE